MGDPAEFTGQVLGTFSFLFAFGLCFQIWALWKRTGLFPVVSFRQGSWFQKTVSVGGFVYPALMFAYAMNPAAFDAGRIPWLDSWAARIGGLALLCLGLSVVAVAMHTMGAAWRMGTDTGQTAEIVQAGIYSRIRHPIYSGVLLAYLGVWLVCGGWFFLWVLAVFAAGTVAQAVLEERHMTQVFGDAYRDYMARTWRFFPWI